MGEQKLIEKLQQEMQNAPVDIRAEVQLQLAKEKGLQPAQFMVSCSHSFRREYSRDMTGSVVRDDNGWQPLLEIFLSRTGIYDLLPESLFFQAGDSRRASLADLTTDYRENKKKEAAIRRFFQPLEHDFFLLRMHMEEEETSLLNGLQSGILNEYFIRFWDLPVGIPRILLAPLVLLLPHAYKIAGNTGLTAQGLSLILKEQVSITNSSTWQTAATGTFPPVLGEGVLGLDTMCGDTFYEETPVFNIEIGPLQRSHVREYLEGGHRALVLETFNRFFIPVGIDIVVNVLVSPEKRHITLSKEAEPILGYSTYL